MNNRNVHYWTNKEERSEKAISHTKEMEEHYSQEIAECVKNTKVYTPDSVFKDTEKVNQKVYITNLDSVSAVLKYNGNKKAVLNFASYKNPGGMFIKGSKAQEECLCHESFLYNVLKEETDYYNWNNQHKNKALYLNRALYSPDVIFVKDNKTTTCDVITCAAPNKIAAQNYQNITNEENTEVLKSRIEFILNIARENKVDTIILGAYGCGVFGQQTEEVAEIFKNYLQKYKCFKTVVFAIPKDKFNHLDRFRKVFK